MGDLRDLLSLKKASPIILKIRPREEVGELQSPADVFQREGEVGDLQRSHLARARDVLERDVSLHEIDGLELITHDLRYISRENGGIGFE